MNDIDARFTIAASWALAARLLGLQAYATLQQVDDPVDGKTLVVKEPSSRNLVAFNPFNGITIVTPALLASLRWSEYFHTPLDQHLIDKIVTSVGWGETGLPRSPSAVMAAAVADLLARLVHDDSDWHLESVGSPLSGTLLTDLVGFTHELDEIVEDWELSQLSSSPTAWPLSWTLFRDTEPAVVFTNDERAVVRGGLLNLLSGSPEELNLLWSRLNS